MSDLRAWNCIHLPHVDAQHVELYFPPQPRRGLCQEVVPRQAGVRGSMANPNETSGGRGRVYSQPLPSLTHVPLYVLHGNDRPSY